MDGGFLRKCELHRNLTSMFDNGTNILEETIDPCLVVIKESSWILQFFGIIKLMLEIINPMFRGLKKGSLHVLSPLNHETYMKILVESPFNGETYFFFLNLFDTNCIRHSRTERKKRHRDTSNIGVILPTACLVPMKVMKILIVSPEWGDFIYFFLNLFGTCCIQQFKKK